MTTTSNPPANTATDDHRILTELAADVYQAAHNLKLTLSAADGITPTAEAEIDRLINGVQSTAESLAQSGIGRTPAGGVRDAHRPDYAAEQLGALHADITKLAIGLDQAGIEHSPQLMHGLELLEALAVEMLSSEDGLDVANTPAVAFDVPAHRLNLQPVPEKGNRAHPHTLDQASRNLSRLLSYHRQNREAPPEHPVGAAMNQMLDIADAGRENNVTKTFAAVNEARKNQKTYRAEDGAREYEPPKTYRHGDNRKIYKGKPRTTIQRPW